MKIKNIKIVISEEKVKLKKTNAILSRYDISSNYNPNYGYNYPDRRYSTFDHNDIMYEYSNQFITMEFICPKCAAEFVVKKRFEGDKNMEVVCTCGLELNVWPQEYPSPDRYYYL